MTPLSMLLAWSARNAPPVAVPDARRHLAVLCVEQCDSTLDLEVELDRRARQRRRLPRRASAASYTLQVLPIGVYGVWDDTASEFLLVSLAGPTSGAVARTDGWDAQIADYAEAEGGAIHDLDTGRVEDASSFRERTHLADHLALDWSEDGTRVVTRGLRALGVHEVVVEDVPPALGAELSTVLVWLAADMLDERGPYETRTLNLDDLDQDLAGWVAMSIWYEDDPGVLQIGSRTGSISFQNARAVEGDPEPPVLIAQFGDAGLAAWLDEVLGRGSLQDESPWEEPVSP